MKRFWLFLFLLPAYLSAQPDLPAARQANWVENGSFEDYLSLPRRIEALGIMTAVEAWYQPTRGSADYYHADGGRECGVPDNKLGTQLAFDGKAYCGIYCSKDEYREYLQSQLVAPLEAGRTYRISFWVSLSEFSAVSVATLGALFTAERIGDTSWGILMSQSVDQFAPGVSQTRSAPYRPQVQNSAQHRLDDTERWQRVSGEFVAQGGERFVTIGNFCTAAQSGIGQPASLTGLLSGAYYYIDSVTLTCLDCSDNAAPVDDCSAQQPAVGDVMVLNELFFEFDKCVILQQSFPTLKRLMALLDSYPNMRITVQGHTDNRGTPSYNQRLSERRAKAVVDYLIAKGVNKKRLEYVGYGDSQPIADNNTEEGRAANRRVAFVIRSM